MDYVWVLECLRNPTGEKKMRRSVGDNRLHGFKGGMSGSSFKRKGGDAEQEKKQKPL